MSGDSLPGRGSYLLSRRLFLTLLGGIFVVAFSSIWVQIHALVGSDGILPATDLMDRAREKLGAAGVAQLPTLCWLRCSDADLHALCAAGVLCSGLLAAGIAPSLMAALAWLLYLSLASVGNIFLGYQWDVLLLEAGFLAIFLAPRQLRPRDAFRSRVPRSALWLLRWLFFRLFFLAGAVKLLSGDPTWGNLTAMRFHYFTQPLPSPTSFYAHHLPDALHTFSAGAMFAIELALPFLAFGPRCARQVACAGCVGLMLLIGATGNYGFFNLLGVALCVPLLDDRALRALTPALLRGRLPEAEEAALPVPSWPGRAAFAALAVAIVVLTGTRTLERLGRQPPAPEPWRTLLEATRPLRTFNSYGLFAVMTTERPEIVLEGSADGERWETYEFRYKAGPVDRAPPFVQPHMPRLDWQLWFAALRGCRGAPWFQLFQARLLAGDHGISGLLERDPFPDTPPRWIRSTLYLYRFAPLGNDTWWVRERRGAFCPAVGLRDGRLIRAEGL